MTVLKSPGTSNEKERNDIAGIQTPTVPENLMRK
jgi:hypothetical protein